MMNKVNKYIENKVTRLYSIFVTCSILCKDLVVMTLIVQEKS